MARKRGMAIESADNNDTQKPLPLFVDQNPTKKQRLVSTFEALIHGSNENAQVEFKKILREDNDDSIVGFNSMELKESEISVDDVDKEKKRHCYEDAISFLNEVSKRFEHENSTVYEAFLGVLTSYIKSQEGNMSLSSVFEKVSEIFCGHQDLVEDFKLFLPVFEALGNEDSEYHNKVGLEARHKKGFVFCEKVKGYFGRSDKYLQFLKFLHCYSTGAIEKTGLRSLIAHLLENNSQLLRHFDDLFDRYENNLLENKKSKSINKEKYKEKSIQELDFSNSENCSPSYWRLPEDYPISDASNRNKLCSEVLNDKWVCRASILQGSSFKNKHISKHEERIFECEDEKYEIDMLIEKCRSCIRSIERVLKNSSEGSEVPCGITLPVILYCMKEKEKNLMKYRSINDKDNWSKVFAKHCDKALGKRKIQHDI